MVYKGKILFVAVIKGRYGYVTIHEWYNAPTQSKRIIERFHELKEAGLLDFNKLSGCDRFVESGYYNVRVI